MTAVHFVIMGVSGSGKTTAALGLQGRLNCPYAEGDDFHTQANRDKMGAGIPLNDDDRAPWLANLRDWMTAQAENGAAYSIVTCSALKKAYRDILRGAAGRVRFIHLQPPEDVNKQRLEARVGHYMKASMLDSQLAILEPLTAEEDGVVIAHAGTPQQVEAEILAWLESAV